MLDQRIEAPPEPPAVPSRWSSLRSRITAVEIAVVVAFLAPLTIWAWRVIGFGNRFQYWSDNANNELSSLDVGSEFVAIGSYSRKVWSHPGPLGFYLLAIPAHLSRQNSVGLAVGVLAINVGAIAGILFLARRRGGTPLLVLTAALLAVFLHGVGPAFLVDVWHPTLPVLPFTLLLFLCWNIALGERWSVPFAVAVATFCVHEHVGYVVVATVPLAAALVIGFGSSWFGDPDERRGRLGAWLRPLAVGTVVGLLLWAPPIIEEVRGNPGNISLIAAYFNDGDGDQPAGLDFAWERQGTALGVRPTWVTGEAPTQLIFRSDWIPSPNPPVTLLVLAVGVALAVRRRDRQGIVGGAIAGVGVLTGLLAAARVTGFPYFYLTRWTMALGWFATVVGLWLIVTALLEWRPKARLAVVSASLVLLAVMATLLTSNVIHERNPQAPWGPIAHELAVEVADNLPPGPGPVQFRQNVAYQAMAHRSALITALERRGIETSVENDNPITHGKWRTGTAPTPRVTLLVAVDEQIDDIGNDPGYRLIAEVRPHTRAEQREAQRYIDELNERLAANDIPSWSELDRGAYLGEVHAIAVFVVPENGP